MALAQEKEHQYREQEVLNRLFREEGQGLSLGEYTLKLDYSGSDLIYVGWAAPGTLVTAAEWRIIKLTWSGSNLTDVQNADGNRKFDNIWNDRAAAGKIYS